MAKSLTCRTNLFDVAMEIIIAHQFNRMVHLPCFKANEMERAIQKS